VRIGPRAAAEVLTIEVGGIALALLPERAAFVPAAGVLLVADAHLGKAASFRSLGVPVPEGTTAVALARLSAALERTRARHLVFLGDLLHSARGRAAGTLEAVRRWRAQHAGVAMTLVRGNHDGHAGDPPADWDVPAVDAPLGLAELSMQDGLSGLALAHEPDAPAAAYLIAGHVHPAAVVAGRGGERLRLPCFHFGARCGVLPAFGEFTGSHVLPRAPGDRVFVVAGDAVRELPAAAARDAP
jgi:DNA ligase-associated metallophosphoesterase